LSLNKWIKEEVNKGYIHPSKSPQALPFFFIKKKDGKLRPVQDYWVLNEATIKNWYPLPLIGDTIDKLRGAKVFTKFDIRWGYNNVRIKKGDEWKAAFKTPIGLFEPMVMYFGLCYSPATFQAMMNHLFKNLIDRGVVVVYMDNILIFTETRDEHKKVTQEVLQILQENNLYLKPQKCEFEKNQIEYLSMIISHNHVAMDPVKTKAIEEWQTPTKVQEIQVFCCGTRVHV
jgi:hypothetical protein